MYNLIYRVRKMEQGRVDTRGRTIYYYVDEQQMVTGRKHQRLHKEFGFAIQSEFVR